MTLTASLRPRCGADAARVSRRHDAAVLSQAVLRVKMTFERGESSRVQEQSMRSVWRKFCSSAHVTEASAVDVTEFKFS